MVTYLRVNQIGHCITAVIQGEVMNSQWIYIIALIQGYATGSLCATIQPTKPVSVTLVNHFYFLPCILILNLFCCCKKIFIVFNSTLLNVKDITFLPFKLTAQRNCFKFKSGRTSFYCHYWWLQLSFKIFSNFIYLKW